MGFLNNKNIACVAGAFMCVSLLPACETTGSTGNGTFVTPTTTSSGCITGNRATRGAVRDTANVLLRSAGKAANEAFGRDWGRVITKAARRQVQDAVQCRR